MCRNGFVSSEPALVVMKVTGSGKADLRWDGLPNVKCPEASACKHGYVLPGQEVLVGHALGAFVCAFYVESNSAGWMQRSRLEPVPERNDTTQLANWTGVWIINKNEDSRIEITRDGVRLKVKGRGYWPGRLFKPTKEFPFSRQVGGFDFSAAPTNGRVELSAGDDAYACKVTLRRVADYLIASDNGECGAMNVRFSDVYWRRPRR